MIDLSVPIDYDVGMEGVLETVTSIVPALRLQNARARAAELQDDAAVAAVEYAKLFALANKTDREGLLVHLQKSTAYRRAALTGLKSVMGELSREQKSDVVSILSGNGYRPVDIDAILVREDNLAKKEHGTLMVLLQKWHTGKLRQASVEQAKALDAEIRQLENEVAVYLAD